MFLNVKIAWKDLRRVTKVWKLRNKAGERESHLKNGSAELR